MKIRVRGSSEIKPSVTLARYQEGDSQELMEVTYQDGVFSQETALTSGFIAVSQDPQFRDISVVNLTPEICSTESWPAIQYVSSGHGKLRLDNGTCASLQTVVMSDAADYALIPKGFSEGSAAGITWALLRGLLDASSDDAIFTNSPSLTPNGVFNPNCWAASFDFTAVMAGFWFGGQWVTSRGGVAVTSQHVLGVFHYQHNIGDQIRFALGSGQFVTRTIIGKSQDFVNGVSVPPTNPYRAVSNSIIDNIIYTLDSPLPGGITIPKIGGHWLIQEAEDAPTPSARWRWAGGAMIQVNQFREAKLVLNCPPSGSSYAAMGGEDLFGVSIPFYDWSIGSSPPLSGPLAEYSNRTYVGISGDSGQPWFVPISGNELALVCLFTYPTAGQVVREDILNALIGSADGDAVSRGGIVSPTGLTVTVAPDPSL